MALISCVECGKKVSDMAKACNECGFPISDYVHVAGGAALVDDTETGSAESMRKMALAYAKGDGVQRISPQIKYPIGRVCCAAFNLM